MTSVTTQRSKDDFSRIFDTVAGADGFNRYLINRGMYLNSANISPSMITMYTVRLNDMYTNISFNFYGTIDLWWLVCKMNDINNPFERLNPGTILNHLPYDGRRREGVRQQHRKLVRNQNCTRNE